MRAWTALLLPLLWALDPHDPSRALVVLDVTPAAGPHAVQVHNPGGLPSNEVPFVAE
jgi:hypothetical protein